MPALTLGPEKLNTFRVADAGEIASPGEQGDKPQVGLSGQ